MKLFILSILLISSNSLIAQEYYTSIASGLAIRKSADPNSDIIGRLGMDEFIEIIERTNIPFQVENDGEIINGFWVKIKTLNNVYGFVFDGFILKKQINEPNSVHLCGNSSDSCSQINFSNFTAFIYNFDIQDNQQFKKDTIAVFECVFNEIMDKTMEIRSKSEVDSISVYYTVVETISEQYNRKKYGKHKDWNIANKWIEQSVRWEGFEPFRKIDQKRNFFRIPATSYEGQELFRKAKMNLRDTFVDLSGESDNIATLVYKNKACRYRIDRVILKIVLYKNGISETKYLDVELSYGC